MSFPKTYDLYLVGSSEDELAGAKRACQESERLCSYSVTYRAPPPSQFHPFAAEDEAETGLYELALKFYTSHGYASLHGGVGGAVPSAASAASTASAAVAPLFPGMAFVEIDFSCPLDGVIVYQDIVQFFGVKRVFVHDTPRRGIVSFRIFGADQPEAWSFSDWHANFVAGGHEPALDRSMNEDFGNTGNHSPRSPAFEPVYKHQ